MTSPRERFLAILQGRAPDSLPLAADLTYWYAAQMEDGALDPRYHGDEGFFRLHEDLGCVFYFEYDLGHPWAITHEGVEEVRERRGDETVTRIRTRSGELVGRTRYLASSHSSAVVEYMVKRPEDLRIVREYAESERYTPTFDEFIARDRQIGDRGMPLAALPRSPLAWLMVGWAGVEMTSYLYADARDELEKTLQCIDETLDPVFDLACQSPVYLFHFTDNLSAENVGGFCSRYIAPYYTKRVAQLHGAGKMAVTHLDGTIRGLLGQLAATGMDAVEALTPSPVGDVALEDLRAEAGNDRVVLWGGLPGALFAKPYGRDDVLRQVEKIRSIFGTTGRFLPGTADQVPPDADIGLVRLASEALATP